MSKLYAVSYMDFYDNNMTIEYHRGNCWQDALIQHTQTAFDEEFVALLRWFVMEDAQEAAFNDDWLFDVVEVPND